MKMSQVTSHESRVIVLTFAWGDGTPIVDLPGADGDDDGPTYQSCDAEAAGNAHGVDKGPIVSANDADADDEDGKESVSSAGVEDSNLPEIAGLEHNEVKGVTGVTLLSHPS